MHESPSQNILRVALAVPLRQLFDYLPPAGDIKARPGMRVVVPFGHRQMVGVIVELANHSEMPLDKLAGVLEFPDGNLTVLTDETLGLLRWCWRYYKHAPGEVVCSALPPALRKVSGRIPPPPVQYRLTAAGEKRLQEPPGRLKAQFRLLQSLGEGPAAEAQLRIVSPSWRKLLARLVEQQWVSSEQRPAAALRPAAGPPLMAEQKRSVDAICDSLGSFHCHLLDGITGSGKTEVYLQVLEQVLREGGQALLLVPEIGLTPQLLARFEKRLGFAPVVTHSGLSEGQRLQAWAMARSGLARLVIGTRSALFLPLSDLQIIILDEEHDASFKQQDGFRYSSRDVAVKRASGLAVPIVLGTATPSLETYNNAVIDRYSWHRLRQRATGAAEPRWRVLDLVQQNMKGGISSAAMKAIGETLAKQEQVLVFLNRRGYAPVILCHECGWHGACQRCDANLTWHKASRRLLCHHCDSSMQLPVMCPECGADALQGAGEGTEQLEQVLGRTFPDTPLLRFDRDTVRKKGEFDRLSEQVKTGESCLLVGTQMLAKGHHFPKVTLVVIVNLDQALYSADFRALERMGQLMVQVAGRAGRDQLPGEVILQTHYPRHESLLTLLTNGYEAFAADIRADRQAACLPPFSYQALLRSDAHQKEDVKAFLNQAKQCFPAGETGIYGPFPAMMERRSGRTRWYLLLQSGQRLALHRQLDEWVSLLHKLPSARRVRWAVDVDPQDY
ncbi:MAG: primosomal protein N' [Gammaproteobacteria bacterium]|nr:primosomal protein N' [Gammaproteobacteria bacterium]